MSAFLEFWKFFALCLNVELWLEIPAPYQICALKNYTHRNTNTLFVVSWGLNYYFLLSCFSISYDAITKSKVAQTFFNLILYLIRFFQSYPSGIWSFHTFRAMIDFKWHFVTFLIGAHPHGTLEPLWWCSGTMCQLHQTLVLTHNRHVFYYLNFHPSSSRYSTVLTPFVGKALISPPCCLCSMSKVTWLYLSTWWPISGLCPLVGIKLNPQMQLERTVLNLTSHRSAISRV